jgi:hypothetical protein
MKGPEIDGCGMSGIRGHAKDIPRSTWLGFRHSDSVSHRDEDEALEECVPSNIPSNLSRRNSLRHRVNIYKMKEEREITPEKFARLVSSSLYERRYAA